MRYFSLDTNCVTSCAKLTYFSKCIKQPAFCTSDPYGLVKRYVLQDVSGTQMMRGKGSGSKFTTVGSAAAYAKIATWRSSSATVYVQETATWPSATDGISSFLSSRNLMVVYVRSIRSTVVCSSFWWAVLQDESWWPTSSTAAIRLPPKQRSSTPTTSCGTSGVWLIHDTISSPTTWPSTKCSRRASFKSYPSFQDALSLQCPLPVDVMTRAVMIRHNITIEKRAIYNDVNGYNWYLDDIDTTSPSNITGRLLLYHLPCSSNV